MNEKKKEKFHKPMTRSALLMAEMKYDRDYHLALINSPEYKAAQRETAIKRKALAESTDIQVLSMYAAYGKRDAVLDKLEMLVLKETLQSCHLPETSMQTKDGKIVGYGGISEEEKEYVLEKLALYPHLGLRLNPSACPLNELRREAVGLLENQSILENIARNTQNEYVCAAAIEKLDNDALVREIANGRYKTVCIAAVKKLEKNSPLREIAADDLSKDVRDIAAINR